MVKLIQSLSKAEKILLRYIRKNLLEDRREYDVHMLAASEGLTLAEAQELYRKIQARFS